MSKIIIEITDDYKTIVTYDNNHTVYPICDVTEDEFHINETTDSVVLELISSVIYACGMSLKSAVIDKNSKFNALLKPSDVEK